MSEGNFHDNEHWLSRARPTPSCFSGWNHSANAAPSITIRLETLATPLFKHPIHLDILANTSSDHSIRLETQAAPIFKYSIRLDILANAAPDYPIRLETQAAPLFKHSIHLDILANAAPDYPIRLETLATPLFNHPIRFGVPAMGEKLPHRGYTFDSPGLLTIGGYPG